RLGKVVVGDPASEGVKMGPLVGRDQAEDAWSRLQQLKQECSVSYGGEADFPLQGCDNAGGAFFPITLLRCEQPFTQRLVHELEIFGPVSTLMAYDSIEDAIALARLGKGSLAASLFTHDDAEARQVILATAPWHGRMLVINRDCA